MKSMGRKITLTVEEALALQRDPDGDLREKACLGLYREMGRRAVVCRNILNAVILDHCLERGERGFSSPVQPVLVESGADEPLLEGMMKAVEERYPMARRYYRVKARLLGRKKIRESDLYAPLGPEAPALSFDRAEGIVLSALGSVHPFFRDIAARAFEQGWIDAAPRREKIGGAFCKALLPGIPPYISLHFSGRMRDLSVLVHELGHAVHFSLSGEQSALDFEPSPLIAETASTFFELLVSAHLPESGAGEVTRQAVLANQIEGLLLTIFRQNVLTRFETALHLQRQDHPLGMEEICECWLRENKELYGSDVEMLPGGQWGWTLVPHFIHRPFYCMNYVFGNLLAVVLFERYNRDPGSIEQILSLLSAGASRSPLERLNDTGLDPAKKGFWEPSFGYMERLILETESRPDKSPL
jgi:oligoendopeptidase F